MKKKTPVKRASKGGCPKNIKMAEVIVSPITAECIMKMAKEMDDSLPRWVSVEDERPRAGIDILFTDGKQIYYGWLDTYDVGEELSFFARRVRLLDDCYPEGVTHWMRLPPLPVID
jgi:hypothetical protein